MSGALAAYLGQAAWPELIHGCPAVGCPPHVAALPARGNDGWCGQRQPEGWTEPHPQWSADLNSQQSCPLTFLATALPRWSAAAAPSRSRTGRVSAAADPAGRRPGLVLYSAPLAEKARMHRPTVGRGPCPTAPPHPSESSHLTHTRRIADPPRLVTRHRPVEGLRCPFLIGTRFAAADEGGIDGPTPSAGDRLVRSRKDVRRPSWWQRRRRRCGTASPPSTPG